MSTIRTPNKGKCTFITPKSNRCSKHQVYIPEVGEETARRGKKRPREESGDDSPCRSHPWKIRVQCCLEYHDWIRDGSRRVSLLFLSGEKLVSIVTSREGG